MVDYLKQYAASCPDWLTTFKAGQTLPLTTILSSDFEFYPGAGNDGQPIKTCNCSLFTYVHVYADYMVTSSLIINECRNAGLKGYHLLDHFSIPVDEFTSEEAYSEYEKRHNRMGFGNADIYCEAFIFEKDVPEIVEGAHRLALIYMGMDANFIYEKVLAENHNLPRLLVLQDHGFGGNYTRFGQDGLLHRIAVRYSFFPPYLLCATNTHLWQEYRDIPGISSVFGGMWNHERKLYMK